MHTVAALRRALVGICLVLLLPAAARAQSADTKPPPRLPPTPSQSAQIPNGIDSGSTQTNGSMPLGTPVPPSNAVGTTEQRTRSAAARAAARPDPLTRNGAPLATPAPLVGEAVAREAAGKAASAPRASARASATSTGDTAAFRKSMSQCSVLAKRSDRAACISEARGSQGAKN